MLFRFEVIHAFEHAFQDKNNQPSYTIKLPLTFLFILSFYLFQGH